MEAGDLKPRIVVLTDIAPGDREPDDMESVVRLLSHADLFEIEAFITTSGWNSGGGAYSDEWAANGKGNRNPQIMINGLSGLEPIVINVISCDTVELDTTGSVDPDGDLINYPWWILEEAGDNLPKDNLSPSESGKIKIKIPANYQDKEIHVICEATDSGNIPLTSYRRIILKTH